MIADLRLAWRGLRRTRGFTIVAMLSLALGLALTASTVAVTNAYLIRSVPYPDADRLYHVRYAPPGPWEPRGMSTFDWTTVSDVVEQPIAALGETFRIRDGGWATALRVNRGFSDGLRVGVALGRRLHAQDFAPGAESPVVIGYALWRDRFALDPAVLGRALVAEAESRPGRPEMFRIVGVLSPDFYFGRDSTVKPDLLVPEPGPLRAYMARLRAGVPQAAAERRLTDAVRLAATSPIPDDWPGVQFESVHERYVASVRPVLVGITIAASLVLVIVCANVAVLMLLRAMRRQKEVAVRLALGSTWRHIARMLGTEALLIIGGALAAGLALTAIALGALAPLIETQLGRPAPRGTSAIALDTNVLLLIGGVSALAVLVLSLAPLLTFWSGRLSDALRRDGRGGTEGPAMRRLRSTLIAFEVAGSLVLLVGCGLMVRSVIGMIQTDFGSASDGLARARIVLRARNYADAAAYQEFYRRFAERAAHAAGSPLVFSNWPPFYETPEQTVEADDASTTVKAGTITVSAGYFEMLGIGIRQGRGFAVNDQPDTAPVTVISNTLARQLWPDGSALGRRIRMTAQTPNGPTAGPWRTVIGIAGDVRQVYADANQNDVYTPMFPDSRFQSFYVRTSQPLTPLTAAFRAAAVAIDPDAIVNDVHTVASENRALEGMQFLTSTLTALAGIAAFLAALGIYAVTAYAVQQREKEIAIRVALGASGRGVIALFLKEGVLRLGLGVCAGLAGATLAVRALRHQVFGLQTLDLWPHAIACLFMIAAGVVATWWPARRAASRSPIAGLRQE